MLREEYINLDEETLLSLFKQYNYSLYNIDKTFGFPKSTSERLFKRKGIDYNKLKNDHIIDIKNMYESNPNRCKFCNKPLSWKDRKKSFCNSSCAASYNNTHKTTGTRVSKLELYLQKELLNKYDFKILFNNKTTINSELDIYIPSLNLAFELNGIYHYKPIHGKKTLNKIQRNDKIKLERCMQKNIKLLVIDTTEQLRFSENSSNKFLDYIISVIDLELSKTNS